MVVHKILYVFQYVFKHAFVQYERWDGSGYARLAKILPCIIRRHHQCCTWFHYSHGVLSGWNKCYIYIFGILSMVAIAYTWQLLDPFKNLRRAPKHVRLYITSENGGRGRNLTKIWKFSFIEGDGNIKSYCNTSMTAKIHLKFGDHDLWENNS